MSVSDAAQATFEEHRALLLGVAYRIVGQMSDAEDVVQEAWLRWSSIDHAEVRDPRAFLVRVVTRLSIDRLRRIRARRESYVGDWLPEPLPTADGPEGNVERRDSVSMALLVVLETLSPLERAVFVLREAFGFTHAEIAEALGRTEEAVRQLARRAREHVEERRPRFASDPVSQRRVADRFLAAALTGDLAALIRVLSPGVTLTTDSGGHVRAPLRALEGAEKVARFLAAISARGLPGPSAAVMELNGAPAIVVRSEGAPVAAFALDVDGELIERIYLIANPAKITRLGVAQPN